MNREIKFRVWDNFNEQFLKSDTANLNFLYNGQWLPVSKFIGSESYTIQQFTGLKDKNGKEIYEGDIIKYITISDEGIFSETVGGLVIFESGSFMCYYKEAKIKVKLEAWLLETTMTMVGNIFENPNLLDNTSKI